MAARFDVRSWKFAYILLTGFHFFGRLIFEAFLKTGSRNRSSVHPGYRSKPSRVTPGQLPSATSCGTNDRMTFSPAAAAGERGAFTSRHRLIVRAISGVTIRRVRRP